MYSPKQFKLKKLITASLLGLVVTSFAVQASAQTIQVKGVATVSDTESQIAIDAARYEAIADSLRQLTLSQPNRVLSSTLVGTNQQLHDSTYIASQVPLKALKIIHEGLLGGVYQVTAQANVGLPTFDQQCTPNQGLKHTVGIAINNRIDYESDYQPSFDAPALLLHALESLKRSLQQEATLVVKERHYFKHHRENPYNAAYLNHREVQDEQLIELSIETQPNGTKNSSSFTLNTVHSINAAGLLPVKLTAPKTLSYETYRLSVKLNDSETLSSPTFSADANLNQVESWIASIRDNVKQSISCQPVTFTVTPRKDGRVKLAAGKELGITAGQQLLLLDKTSGLKIDLSDINKANFGLYSVEKVSKNHAILKVEPGSLSVTATGKKVVIPF